MFHLSGDNSRDYIKEQSRLSQDDVTACVWECVCVGTSVGDCGWMCGCGCVGLGVCGCECGWLWVCVSTDVGVWGDLRHDIITVVLRLFFGN